MSDHRVDVLIGRAGKWADTFAALRVIMLDLGFEEGFKWRQAAYMIGGKNVALISTMKDSCALNLFKGALLSDSAGLLQVPGPNSQSARWMKFTSPEEVRQREPHIRSYLTEAMAHERAGTKVAFKAKEVLELPDELTAHFADDPDFEVAFRALTPGRQRGWVLHYSSAKQAATRTSRIVKSAEKIRSGKGWNER